MRNPKAPTFGANYNWVTTHMHGYKPRYVTDVIRNMLCETLVRNDTAFRQVLRQCKDTWILAVTLGKDTISLKIFDTAEVDDPKYRPISSSVVRDLTSFFEIDRELNIRQLTSERVDRVMRTAPMLYADRCLKASEISTCDSIERSMMQPAENATVPVSISSRVAGPNDHLVRFDDQPEFTLEPTTPLEA